MDQLTEEDKQILDADNAQEYANNDEVNDLCPDKCGGRLRLEFFPNGPDDYEKRSTCENCGEIWSS